MNGQRLRYAVPAAVTGLALLPVLAGCTTGSPAPPTGSTTGVVVTASASPSTSSGSPSASTSGSATRPPYPTDVPADALADNSKGAEAFTRHFLQRILRGFMGPTPGTIGPLSTSTCKSCANYEKGFEDLVAQRRHFEREPFTVTEVVVVPDTAPGSVISLDAVLKQNPVRVYDASGSVAETWPEKTGILVIDLVRTEGHWLVNGVRVRQ